MISEKIKIARERAKVQAIKVKRETKKQLLTALVAAFGFLIALEWRDVISGYVNLIESFSPIQGQLIGAIIVTVIAVLGIIIVNQLLSEPQLIKI